VGPALSREAVEGNKKAFSTLSRKRAMAFTHLPFERFVEV
jgi:hypothetical protein